MNSPNIEKLRDLTSKLMSLQDLVRNGNGVTYKEYAVQNGTSFGFGLYDTPEVAVQRVFMSKDSIFPEHIHAEREWGIVYKGKIIMEYEGTEQTLGVGDCMFFEADAPHRGRVLEDTWVIFITVPAGEGYPHGKSA